MASPRNIRRVENKILELTMSRRFAERRLGESRRGNRDFWATTATTLTRALDRLYRYLAAHT